MRSYILNDVFVAVAVVAAKTPWYVILYSSGTRLIRSYSRTRYVFQGSH